MIFGIDLGVRSITIAGIHAGLHENMALHWDISVPKTKGLIRDQPTWKRSYELAYLAKAVGEIVTENDQVFIEEPPMAGSRNVRVFGQLSMTAGAVGVGVAATTAWAHMVPVDTWKMRIVGKGGVSKEKVSAFLQQYYPSHYKSCNHDQNRVDATCIALYGQSVVEGTRREQLAKC